MFFELRLHVGIGVELAQEVGHPGLELFCEIIV